MSIASPVCVGDDPLDGSDIGARHFLAPRCPGANISRSPRLAEPDLARFG
jgi:hypothetical protein